MGMLFGALLCIGIILIKLITMGVEKYQANNKYVARIRNPQAKDDIKNNYRK